MKESRSIGDLAELDAMFQALCAGMKILPGSLFRIAEDYLAAWGITVEGTNTTWIEQQGNRSYVEEWRNGTHQTNDAIRNAIRAAGLVHDNENLNSTLAGMAVPLLVEVAHRNPGRTIRVLDVGAGAGDTTLKLITELDLKNQDDTLRRCEFYLLEPSPVRVHEAVMNIERHGPAARVKPIGDDFYSFFDMLSDGSVDFLISNAVFHHMTTSQYIRLIHAKLADSGVVVVGDWYTSIWSRPGFFVPLMQSLGASPEAVVEFEHIFGVQTRTRVRDEIELSPGEREANRYMQAYINHLAVEMQHLEPRSRVLLLEAHESLDQRLDKFYRHGFMTDPNDLKEKYTAFTRGNIRRVYPHCGDLAAIFAVTKR